MPTTPAPYDWLTGDGDTQLLARGTTPEQVHTNIHLAFANGNDGTEPWPLLDIDADHWRIDPDADLTPARHNPTRTSVNIPRPRNPGHECGARIPRWRAPHNPRRSPDEGPPTGHIVRLRGDLLQHTTCACGRPSGDDAYVCTHCADQTRTALQTIVDGLDADLTVTLAKQDQLVDPHAGSETKPTKASEAPLPLNMRAVEARSILRNTLSTWVRLIHDDGPESTSLPADTVEAMAKWLLPTVGWLRHRDYGTEFVDEVTAAVGQATRAIDLVVRRVPIPAACTEIWLEGATPVSCGGARYAIFAPGLPSDGQIRCENDPEHTTTVAAQAVEKQRSERRKARLGARLTKLV